MARIRITENELKQIIRESVIRAINEDWQPFYTAPTNKFSATDERFLPHDDSSPSQSATPSQQSTATTRNNHPESRPPLISNQEIDNKNAANSGALNSWKKLGTVGQIRLIQKLAGIPASQCDGRIGPQTLAKVYIALSKGKSGEGIIDSTALSNSSFMPGRQGTYTPISHN